MDGHSASAMPFGHDTNVTSEHTKKWVKMYAEEVFPTKIQKAADKVQTLFGDRAKEPRIASLITNIGALKNCSLNNGEFTLLNDPLVDVSRWNQMIKSIAHSQDGKPMKFQDMSLLWTESYVIRKLSGFFSNAGLPDDEFQESKSGTFFKTCNFFMQTSMYLIKTVDEIKEAKEDKDQVSLKYLEEYLNLSAWANELAEKYLPTREALANLSSPPLEAKKLRDQLHVAKTNAFKCLTGPLAQGKPLNNQTQPQDNSDTKEKQVDIVLGGSQNDLFVDLCLAELLIASGLASTVQFHVQQTIDPFEHLSEKDFHWMFRMMNMVNHFGLAHFLGVWKQRLSAGEWRVRADSFWTLPLDFSSMKDEAPELYGELAKSSLVIFKGDFNYRKLTRDFLWQPTVSLHDAMGSWFKLTPLITVVSNHAEHLMEENPDVDITSRMSTLIDFIE